MPHGMCYLWRPEILVLHVASDSLITLAYFTIPFTLVYFARKRTDMRFGWVFVCFAVFIVACGASHFMEIWTVWHPTYWLSGAVKAVTALASVPTAILLVKLVPAALRVPGPMAWEAANAELAREVLERKRAEASLLQVNALLETRVAERTAELGAANHTLTKINARFAIAAEAAGLGFWDFDLASNTFEWDKTMFQLYDRPRLDGAPPYALWAESLHPDDRQKSEHTMTLARNGVGSFESEFRVVRPDGEIRHLRSAFGVARDEEGLAVQMFGVAFDITERKRADEGRRALNAELEQRVGARTSELKERESLLQEVHHRVKNNLQVISSLINMQIRGLAEESSRIALRECQSRLETMAEIHEMLYQSDNYAQVPFAKYAKNLTTRVLSASGTSASNIALEFELEQLSLPVEQAIPCGLILNELVANSLKHGFPNATSGAICVELRRVPDHSVCLAVSDNGIGISPTLDLKALSSLGVQLVMTLVEQIQGHLEIIRQPGSSFRITFPLESRT